MTVLSSGRSLLPVVVAPEVVARITARHAAGEPIAVIGRDLHLTLPEVTAVVRAAVLEPVETQAAVMVAVVG
jgi:hypothetical protein